MVGYRSLVVLGRGWHLVTRPVTSNVLHSWPPTKAPGAPQDKEKLRELSSHLAPHVPKQSCNHGWLRWEP